jgi:hypothetical protein
MKEVTPQIIQLDNSERETIKMLELQLKMMYDITGIPKELFGSPAESFNCSIRNERYIKLFEQNNSLKKPLTVQASDIKL